jgi:hypothetical protein
MCEARTIMQVFKYLLTLIYYKNSNFSPTIYASASHKEPEEEEEQDNLLDTHELAKHDSEFEEQLTNGGETNPYEEEKKSQHLLIDRSCKRSKD